MRVFVTILAMTAALALTGCSTSGQLMTLQSSGDGPDEFGIVPTRPLQMPADLAQLPPPTPGGTNITDPVPRADAVASLGGNPGLLSVPGIGAADAALVAYSGRLGRDGNIRAVTAAEDQAFRARHGRRLLEVVFRTNVYMRAYAPMSLDPHAEMDRFRRAGVRTPSAPPPPAARTGSSRPPPPIRK